MIIRRSLLALMALFAFSGSALAPVPLTVLAAASLKEVMDAQGAAFAKAGGPRARFSYAASSALATSSSKVFGKPGFKVCR